MPIQSLETTPEPWLIFAAWALWAFVSLIRDYRAEQAQKRKRKIHDKENENG